MAPAPTNENRIVFPPGSLSASAFPRNAPTVSSPRLSVPGHNRDVTGARARREGLWLSKLREGRLLQEPSDHYGIVIEYWTDPVCSGLEASVAFTVNV